MGRWAVAYTEITIAARIYEMDPHRCSLRISNPDLCTRRTNLDFSLIPVPFLRRTVNLSHLLYGIPCENGAGKAKDLPSPRIFDGSVGGLEGAAAVLSEFRNRLLVRTDKRDCGLVRELDGCALVLAEAEAELDATKLSTDMWLIWPSFCWLFNDTGAGMELVCRKLSNDSWLERLSFCSSL